MVQIISNILFIIAGLIWGIEQIPQIVKTVKTKKVDDISPMFYILCLTAYVTFFIGASLIRQWFLIFSHLISFISVILMLLLLKKYQKEGE